MKTYHSKISSFGAKYKYLAGKISSFDVRYKKLSGYSRTRPITKSCNCILFQQHIFTQYCQTQLCLMLCGRQEKNVKYCTKKA